MSIIDKFAGYEWTLKVHKKDRWKFIIKLTFTVIILLFSLELIARIVPANYSPFVPLLILWTYIWCFFTFFRTWILKVFAKRKLKDNWLWIVKSAFVSDIKRYKHKNDDWWSYVAYYLVLNDSVNNIYLSKDLWNWKLFTDNKAQLESIYKKYGFEFDQSNKGSVLSNINNEIMTLESEKNEAGLFKKPKYIYDLSCLNDEKEIVENWYHGWYFEFKNWKRVYVWDEIKVYVDPEDKEYYYVDVDDFLRKK